MPPYVYQAMYGIIQTFNFCPIQGESVILDRVSYDDLFNDPTASNWTNYIIQQLAPNRFNFWWDFVSAAVAVYVNNWIMFVWFIAAIPINGVYITWYLIDPVADMPPFIEF